MVLPVREAFTLESAGAISMVVRCHAESAGRAALVIGRSQPGSTYPGIAFRGLAGRSPWHYGALVVMTLLKLSPAIVEVHQQPRLALLLARVFASMAPQIRVMLFLHNDPLRMRGLRRAGSRRTLLKRLHRVICVSDYLRGRYATGTNVECQNLTTLHNPLNLNNISKDTTLRDQEILYAGRIVADKGIDDFIAACKQALPHLPGWSARVIGGDRFGPESPETDFFQSMRRAAEAAAIRFDGPQPHDAVMAAMARAALVVVPSRWPEPFGLTALEAMASGAALIAARSGGLPEVAAGAACYVEPGDAGGLAAAMTALANDPAARERLARAGLERAQLFAAPVIAAKLQALRGPVSAL